MKFYKFLIYFILPFIFSACATMPKNMQTLSSALNTSIKNINEVLTESTINKSGLADSQTKKHEKSGMLTSTQCQNAQGKTKAQIETWANEKLTDSRAYSLNSFAVTYNFQISDRVSRYGVNSDSKAVCSLTFDGNRPYSKVLHWGVIG